MTARWGSLEELVDEDGGWHPTRDELFERDHPNAPGRPEEER